MRTKTLLITAALSAAGVIASNAQTVYSANAVGFVNVPLVEGFNLVANPLDNTTDNTIGTLFDGAPNFTVIYKWDAAGGTYDQNTFAFGGWSDPAMTFAPGEGAFVNIPAGGAYTQTFVGEVMQGDLEIGVPAGFEIRSSMVPQTGLIQTDLAWPEPGLGDLIYTWNSGTQQWEQASYAFGSWSPAEPTIEVGEAFFSNRIAEGTWTRSFSVNN
jgi:hypothetical protein